MQLVRKRLDWMKYLEFLCAEKLFMLRLLVATWHQSMVFYCLTQDRTGKEGLSEKTFALRY